MINQTSIVNDNKESIYTQFATDFLQAVYDRLLDDGLVNCIDIFFLYPSMEKDIMVLRNGKSRVREYIEDTELSEYISFDTTVEVE